MVGFASAFSLQPQFSLNFYSRLRVQSSLVSRVQPRGLVLSKSWWEHPSAHPPSCPSVHPSIVIIRPSTHHSLTRLLWFECSERSEYHFGAELQNKRISRNHSSSLITIKSSRFIWGRKSPYCTRDRTSHWQEESRILGNLEEVPGLSRARFSGPKAWP